MIKRNRWVIYIRHTEFNVSYCEKYLNNEYGSTYLYIRISHIVLRGFKKSYIDAEQ